jgi:L-lactate dehydrogenase complex protein LldG
VYCESEEEFIGKLKNLRTYRQWNKIVAFSPSLQTYLSNYEIHTEIDDENTTVGIGLCHSLIARTGSIILTSAQGVGKHLKHFPPIMIVVAFESQIQDSYKQTLEQLSETPPQWLLSIKTGELIEEEIRELYMFVISG